MPDNNDDLSLNPVEAILAKAAEQQNLERTLDSVEGQNEIANELKGLNLYQLAAGQGQGRDPKYMGKVERLLSAGDLAGLKALLGPQSAEQLAREYVAAANQFELDRDSERSTGRAVTDTAIGVGAGVINAVLGVGAAAAGAVGADKVSAGLVDSIKNFGEVTDAFTSDALLAHKQVAAAKDASAEQDHLAQAKAEEDANPETRGDFTAVLESMGKRVVKDAVSGAINTVTDPTLLAGGVADMGASMLMAGGTGKLLGVLGKGTIKQVGKTAVGESLAAAVMRSEFKALSKTAAEKAVARTALSQTVNNAVDRVSFMGANALLEGGSAFTQTSRSILDADPRELLKTSPEYQKLVSETQTQNPGMSEEQVLDEAKTQLASKAAWNASWKTGLVAAGVSDLIGGQGIDPTHLMKHPGTAKKILGQLVKEQSAEATEETIQGLTGQFMGNDSNRQFVDPSQDMLAGVGTAGGQGGALAFASTGILKSRDALRGGSAAVSESTKAIAGRIAQRGQEIGQELENQSNVSLGGLNQQAQALKKTYDAPETQTVLKSTLQEIAKTSPEAGKVSTETLGELVKASVVSETPESFKNLTPEQVAKIRGEKPQANDTRANLVSRTADAINSETDPKAQVKLVGVLNELLAPTQKFKEQPEELAAFSGSPQATRLINAQRAMLSGIEQLPNVQKAQQKAMETLVKAVEFSKATPVREAVLTPETKDRAQAITALAVRDPEILASHTSPEEIRAVLAHEEGPSYTPQQKALQAVFNFLQVEKDIDDAKLKAVAEGQGKTDPSILKDVEQRHLLRQELTQAEQVHGQAIHEINARNIQGKKKPSARQMFFRIIRAMNAGQVEVAKRQALDLAGLAQSEVNKAAALEDSRRQGTATGKTVQVDYDQYIGKGDFARASTNPTKVLLPHVIVGNAKSEAHAATVHAEASLLSKVVAGISKAYPELSVQSPTVPKQGKTAALAKKPAEKPKPAPKALPKPQERKKEAVVEAALAKAVAPKPASNQLANVEASLRQPDRQNKERAVAIDPATDQVIANVTATDENPLETQFSPADEAKIRANGNVIVTHNHPKTGAFSPGDFTYAMKLNVAEYRAVQSDGTLLRMIRPTTGWPKLTSEQRKTFTDDINDILRSVIDAGKATKLPKAVIGQQVVDAMNAYSQAQGHNWQVIGEFPKVSRVAPSDAPSKAIDPTKPTPPSKVDMVEALSEKPLLPAKTEDKLTPFTFTANIAKFLKTETEFLAKFFRDLSPEKQLKETLLDPISGLLSRTGAELTPFNPAKPVLAIFTLEGKKTLNDLLSHEYMDGVLRVLARELMKGTDVGMKIGSDLQGTFATLADAEKVRDAMQAAVGNGFKIRVAGAERQANQTFQKALDASYKLAEADIKQLRADGQFAPRKAPPKFFLDQAKTPMPKQVNWDYDEFNPKHVAEKDTFVSPSDPAIQKWLKAEIGPILKEYADNRQFAQQTSMPEVKIHPAAQTEAKKFSEEQKLSLAYRYQLTGLVDKRGFEQLRAARGFASVASLDMRALNAMDLRFGKLQADRILKIFGQLLIEQSNGAAVVGHLHGDEFAVAMASPEALERFMANAKELLDTIELYDVKEDGTVVTQTGVSFAYGIGTDLETADADIARRKDPNADVFKPTVTSGPQAAQVLAEAQASTWGTEFNPNRRAVDLGSSEVGLRALRDSQQGLQEDPGQQQQEVTPEQPQSLEPLTGKKTTDFWPNLIQGASNLVHKMLLKLVTKDGKKDLPSTRLQGKTGSLERIQKAVSSIKDATDFKGSDLKQAFSPETAQAFQELLSGYGEQTLQAVLESLDAQLQNYLQQDFYGKTREQHILDGNQDLLNEIDTGKLLNLTEIVGEGDQRRVQFNPELIAQASLAAMQWVLTSGQRQVVEKNEEDVQKEYGFKLPDGVRLGSVLANELNQGSGLIQTKRTLASAIRRFWGLKSNPEVGLGHSDAVSEAAAGELLEALRKAGFLEAKKFRLGEFQENLPDDLSKHETERFIVHDLGTEENPSPLYAYPELLEELIVTEPELNNFYGKDEIPMKDGQLGNPDMDTTEESKQARTQMQNEEFLPNMPFIKAIMTMSVNSFLEAFGTVLPESEEAKARLYNKNDLKAIEGLNRSLLGGRRELIKVMQQMEDRAKKDGVKVEELAKKYQYAINNVNRVMMLGAHTPQSDKTMRESLMSTWSTMDLSDEKGNDYKYTMLALSQLLGQKVHRKTFEQNIAWAHAAINGGGVEIVKDGDKTKEKKIPDLTPVINELVTWLDKGGELPFREAKRILGNDFSRMAMMGLIEMARFKKASPDERKAFRTPIYFEADGMTNGPFNAMGLLSVGEFTPDWINNAGRGGMAFSDSPVTSNILSDKLGDIYTAAMKAANVAIKNLRANLLAAKKQDVVKQMDALYTALRILLPEELKYTDSGEIDLQRSFGKNPLTVLIYGSSEKGVANKITGKLVDAFYEKMSLIAKANIEERTPQAIAQVMFPGMSADKALAQFNSLMVAMNSLRQRMAGRTWNEDEQAYNTGSEAYYPVADTKPKADSSTKEGRIENWLSSTNLWDRLQKAGSERNFTFTAQEFEAVQGNMHHLLVAPMYEGIQKTLGPSVFDSTRKIIRATKIQSRVAQKLFFNAIEAKLAKKEKALLPNIEKIAPDKVARALKGIQKKYPKLTPKEQQAKAVLDTARAKVNSEFLSKKELREIFDSLGNVLPIFESDGQKFLLAKTARGSMFKALTGMAIEYSRSFDGTKRTPPDIMVMDDVGVSAVPYLTIGMGDARMVRDLYMQPFKNSMEVFDGINISAKDIGAKGARINEAAAKAFQGEIFKTLSNVFGQAMDDSRVQDLLKNDSEFVYELLKSMRLPIGTDLGQLIQGIRGDLKQRSYEQEARNAALKTFNFWTDQMAGTFQPHLSKGKSMGVSDVFNKDEISKKLNEEYHKELSAILAREGKSAPAPAPTPGPQRKPTPEFDKLPTHTPGQRTMTYAGIGSRQTPPEIAKRMTELAKELAQQGYTLNSGGATGADQAFERGVDNEKKNIFVVKHATDQTRAIAQEIHPNPKALGPFPLNLMARNTNQVFGAKLNTPVDFVLTWTPDGAEASNDRSQKTGGTGQAIDMASRKGIPVINMAKPGWEAKLKAALQATPVLAPVTTNPFQDLLKGIPVFSEHQTGVQLLNRDGIRKLIARVQTLEGITANEKALLRELALKSSFKKPLLMALGTPTQINQMCEQAGFASPVNTAPGVVNQGFYNPDSNRIFLMNPSVETLVHELIHASTFAMLDAHYRGDDSNLDEFTQVATIERLENLMKIFMEEDFSGITAEQQQALTDARRAISEHIKSGRMAYAVNEFMAWALTNRELEAMLGQQKISDDTVFGRLSIMSKKVWDALKFLIWGGARGRNFESDLLSHIRFNTAVLIKTSPSVNDILTETKTEHDARIARAYTQTTGLAQVTPSNEQLDRLDEVFSQHIAAQLSKTYDEDWDADIETGKEPETVQARLFSLEVVKEAQAAFPDMSDKAKFSFQRMIMAFATEAQIEPSAMTKVQELYTEVMKTLSPSDFPGDAAQAKRKFEFISGFKTRQLKDARQRSAILSTFLALAAVDEGFRKVLETKALKPQSSQAVTGLDSVIENIGSKLMEKLGNRLADIKGQPANVRVALEQLIQGVTKNALDERQSLIDTVEDRELTMSRMINDGLVGVMKRGGLAAFKKGNELLQSNSVVSRGLGASLKALSFIADEQSAAVISEGILKAMDKSPDTWAFARDLAGDLLGRVTSQGVIYDMLKQVRTHVTQVRQMYREHVPFIIGSKFKTKPSESQWDSLHRLMGTYDLASLYEGRSSAEILELVANPAALQEEIATTEGYLQIENPVLAVDYNRKINQFVKFMQTGVRGGNLLTNAYAISELLGEKNRVAETPSEDTITAIDQLMTLKLLAGASEQDKKVFAELFKNEREGIEFTLNYLKGQRVDELKKATQGLAKFNHIKGWINQTHRQGHLTVVEDTPETHRDMTEKGYVRVGEYIGSNIDPGLGVSRSYYFAPDGTSQNTFTQGIAQTAYGTAYGVQTLTGLSLEPNAGLITDEDTVAKIAKRLSQEQASSENLAPIFNEYGEITAFMRTLSSEQTAVLKQPQNLSEAIGRWRGRQIEENWASRINDELVVKLKAMYDADSDPSRYVDIFDPAERAKDKVLDDAVRLLPFAMRNTAERKFGTAPLGKYTDAVRPKMYVRRNLLTTTIGYRQASVGDIWTGTSRWTEKERALAKNILRTFLGAKAFRRLVWAEKNWQAAMFSIRSNIVVRSIVVPAANFVSGLYQLRGRGVPLTAIARGVPAKLREIEYYTSSMAKRVQLEAELRANEENPEKTQIIQSELEALLDSQKNLSIWPLIEAGEFSSITDVGDAIDNREDNQKTVIDKLVEAVDKMPAGLREMARQGYMARDTSVFKALQKATQYSDFVMKSIYYDHLIKNESSMLESTPGFMEALKEARKTHAPLVAEVKAREAMARAKITEEFVNYDLPTGRGRGYLENMGLVWFMNYKLRAAKIGLSMIRNNPFQALMMSVMPDIPGADSPISGNIFGKLFQGVLGYSVSPRMALQPIALNPWYNLIAV